MMTLADTIGYIALGVNLYSMSSRSEHRLRVISVVANLIYVFYGFIISAIPVIIGCSIAVLLHLYRLYKMKTITYGTNTTR